MSRTYVAILATTTLLLGSAALAQQTQTQDSSNQTGSSQSQEQTQVEGVVVSVTNDMLIIQSGAGQQTLWIDAESVVPADLRADQKVLVTYRADPRVADRWIVASVDMSGEAIPSGDASGRNDLDANRSRTAAADQTGTDARIRAGASDERTGARTGDMQANRSRLPQTASPLPVIAIVGLAALVGSVVLRKKR